MNKVLKAIIAFSLCAIVIGSMILPIFDVKADDNVVSRTQD